MSSSPIGVRRISSARRAWARPPHRLGRQLRCDEVDVWRASLDELPPDGVEFLVALLSADELERAQRFYFDRDRRRVIASRGILRLLLSRYLGRPAQTLRFAYGANGKPALVREAGEPEIHFNVAHAEEVALYAFTLAAEVGVDVERVREVPEWESIAASFAADEAEGIRQAPATRRAEEFLRAWTRQEARLKALGVGLGGETPVADSQLQLHPIDAGPHFVGALAADAMVRRANCRAWRAADLQRERIFFGPVRRTNLESPNHNPISFP